MLEHAARLHRIHFLRNSSTVNYAATMSKVPAKLKQHVKVHILLHRTQNISLCYEMKTLYQTVKSPILQTTMTCRPSDQDKTKITSIHVQTALDTQNPHGNMHGCGNSKTCFVGLYHNILSYTNTLKLKVQVLCLELLGSCCYTPSHRPKEPWKAL